LFKNAIIITLFQIMYLNRRNDVNVGQKHNFFFYNLRDVDHCVLSIKKSIPTLPSQEIIYVKLHYGFKVYLISVNDTTSL